MKLELRGGLHVPLAVICAALAGAVGCRDSDPSFADQNEEASVTTQDSGTLIARIKYLEGHSEPVRAVGISPDGEYLVSVGDDSQVIVRSVHNLEEKDVFKPREGGLRCLAFTQNGRYVLSAGNLADFSRDKDIDGFVRIDLKEQKDDFIEVPAEGTILRMTLTNQGKHLVFFCASNELVTLDIDRGRIDKAARLFGGFTEATAISSDSRHFAVTSQNEVNMQATEPYRLTVMKDDGSVTLSYDFDNAREYIDAGIYFPTNDELILCLPNGRLVKWQWSKQQERWETLGTPISIMKGRFSSIGSGVNNNTVWLARDRTLFSMNKDTGEIHKEIEITVGEGKGGIPADPIECLTLLKDQKLLVAGLSDGRLALIPVGDSD